MTRSFYQSHSCDGFSAKVTIEWMVPKKVDIDMIPNRMQRAEDIADAILGFSGPKMRDMVQELRGYPLTSQEIKS
jgi:hypothetical protein